MTIRMITPFIESCVVRHCEEARRSNPAAPSLLERAGGEVWIAMPQAARNDGKGIYVDSHKI